MKVKKVKKFLAPLLACLTSMSLLAGCGQEKNENDVEQNVEVIEKNEDATVVGSESVSDTTGITFPLEETYEFDVVVCGGVGDVYELKDTLIYKYMEEKTNVKLNVTTLTYNEYEEKVNLMINSGDYPDAFIKASAILENYTDQGVIIPLEDYIKEYAPDYSARIEEADGWNTVTSYGGHQYSLFEVGKADSFGGVPYMYINTQWLDNLGLEMPHDPESFYEVMKAFKEKDADGDGDPNNEVPLIFGGGDLTPVECILPYFGYDMKSRGWGWSRSSEESAIEYFALSEEYKEVLAYLTKLYQEGLMHKDSFVYTYEQVGSMAQTGTAVGCFAAWEASDVLGVYNPALSEEENLVMQYEAMVPWDGAKATSASTLHSSGLYITDKCERPELLIAWANLLYTEEYGMIATYGIEGDTYDIVDGAIKKRNENNPSVTYGEKVDAGLLALGGGHVCPSIRFSDNYDVYYDYEENPRVDYVAKITEEWKEMGKAYAPWPSYSLDTEKDTKVSDILADAEPYRKQYRAEVITGLKDLDETWDEYIAKMNEMDIQTAINYTNEAYQEWLNK